MIFMLFFASFAYCKDGRENRKLNARRNTRIMER